jgi:hypothetical protein
MAESLRGLPNPKAASPAKIVIRLIQPVLPRRAKNVNIYRILERLGLVFHERGDVQYFTGPNINYF